MSTENTTQNQVGTQNLEESTCLTPEQLKAQEEAEKVKATGAKVYQLTVGEKIAYLRAPNRAIVSLALTHQAQNDFVSQAEVLLENCWISGDDEIKTEDRYFFGAMTQVQELVDFEVGVLKKY